MEGLFELFAVVLFFVGIPLCVAFLDDFVAEWRLERAHKRWMRWMKWLEE